jgi:hypothetical protein
MIADGNFSSENSLKILLVALLVGMKQEPVCKLRVDLRHPFINGQFEFSWFIQFQLECDGGHPFTPFSFVLPHMAGSFHLKRFQPY